MADVSATLRRASDLMSAGAYTEAHALLARILPKNRDNPNVNASLCRLLTAQGRHAEALPHAERAVRAAPNDVNMLTNLANVLMLVDRPEEAIPLYRRVVAAEPSRRAARAAFCTLLMMRHRAWEASEVARVGVERVPGDSKFMKVRALAMRDCGRSEPALALLKECAALHPRELLASLLVANTMNYIDTRPEETAAAQRGLDGLAAGTPAPPPAVPLEGRRFRVGVFSPDLRSHSVAHFAEPILREFDRERFEFVCFSDADREDEYSAHLSGLATEWHRTGRMDHPEHDALVRERKVDLVLDLAGLTRGNRVEVLKLKPAPVQVTYCGYPNTTGLSTVDYRIVDAKTDPAGYDERCTEKLIRLDPCFLCFSPIKGVPDLGAPPSSKDPAAPIVFGSFNALHKLSDRTVGLWSRVVNAVPGSRLLLKNNSQAEPEVQADIRARFGEAGLDPARIDLINWIAASDGPLRAYDLIDIGLDPTPYNGTTTTIEAALMGVPVVTLEGQTHAGRVGVSLLSTIGHPELIAGTEDAYIRIAKELASDRAGLARLRPALRADLFGSPLCDAKAFTRRFESALLQAWHTTTGL